jgi:hypothetical protein
LGDRMSLLQLFNFALSARRTLYIICRKWLCLYSKKSFFTKAAYRKDFFSRS